MQRVSPSVRDEARGEADRARTLNILIVGVFPVLLALGGVATPSLYKQHASATIFAWAIALIIYAALAYFAHRNPKSFVELVVENSDLQGELRSRSQELDRVKEGARTLNAQAVAAMSLRAASLPYLRDPPATQDGFVKMCGNLLAPLERRLGETLDVEGTESWSFAVYLHSASTQCFTPLWWARSADHPSRGTPRAWGYGQGHVGRSFANETALVTEDARAHGVEPLAAPPPAMQQGYDNVYRSFAAIPFGQYEDNAKPLGVLVGTSNRVGRFSDARAKVLKHFADTVGAIAAMGSIDADCLAEVTGYVEEKATGDADD